jgi:signal transduction histidine kinase
MTALSTTAPRHGIPAGFVAPRVALLTSVVAIAALTSEREDWQPISLFVALCVAMVVADTWSVSARRIRFSAGLMVQVTMMALMGPAPAVASALLSTLIEARVNRVNAVRTLNDLAMFALLGLVGGVLFEVIRATSGLDRLDVGYALLVLPIYLLIAGANLALVAAWQPGLEAADRVRIMRESGLPALPLEFTNGVFAAATVLVWASVGLVAAAGLLVMLVITIPLARTVGNALKHGDDLLALRQVSDQRAAEVARLASDRTRLLSEVLHAEGRERARLAESLHDGPMQRLVAMRQDMAEAGAVPHQMDAAIAETRAIISSFHPATVRELGFEGSLRAAVAPFPAARSIELTVRSAVDDRALVDSVLLPVAQELVVNAVKHASPSAIDVRVIAVDGTIVVEVNDDGVGIDTSEAGRSVQAGHVGLAMVRRRVEDAGGLLEIATRSDGGTCSRVVVPIP